MLRGKKQKRNGREEFELDKVQEEVLIKSNKLNPRSISLKISVSYMIVGTLWIMLSDKVLGLITTDMERVTSISMIKGWAYVLITGLLIYSLVHSVFMRVKNAEDKLYISYQNINEANLQLEHQAFHDQVTGARNRLALIKCINKAISTDSSCKLALLTIDIDNFKYINDTMGHSFGDDLLVSVCERLGRLAENGSDIYRIAGDGFVVMLKGNEEALKAEMMAVRLLKGLKAPFEINGSSLFITISIGIAVYPEHGSSMDELLKNADIALYKAKETGKDRIVIYNTPMNEAFSERVAIEKHLRTALDNNEFELYYQPQLDINEGRVSGLEALIRWKSPELGFVSPLKFIGIAEDTHLIIPIGEWVLKNACTYIKEMHIKGFDGLSVSVNISMLQLLQEDFADRVLDILDSSKLNPEHLELEITESILMESYEVISDKLKLLKDKGIRIALDDFGKGYSSLYYLKQLPISTLKIDKTFIDMIGSAGKHKSLTNLMVRIGRTMGLCVVAEGVETQEQLDYLVKHKCNKIQGYFFSRPVPREKVVDTIKKQGWI